MSGTEDDLYLQNIDEYVHDMDKIVTYKWLAMTLSVTFSEATRMLNTFVQQHSATPTRREPIAVTYLVTGVSHDANNNIDKVIVSLAEEDDLEEVKAGLTEVYTVIVYSVQKGVLKDRSALFSAEYELLKDNIHHYAEMGTVQCTGSSPVLCGKPVVAPNDAHPTLPSLSHMKKEKPDEKQDQKLNQLSQNQQGQKHDQGQKHKLGHHQERSSQHRKGHHKAVSKGGGLVAIFAKQTAHNSTKPSVKDNSKHKGDGQDSVVKSEPQSEAAKQDEPVSIPDEPVSIPNEPVSKQAVKQDIPETRAAKVQDKTSSSSKRNVFDEAAVFTSSEDEAPPETIKKTPPDIKREVKKPTKGKTTTKAPKRRRVCQELSSGESDTETSVKEGGQKKRKTVRKLVDKMFIDEDGSMVTEKEWQEISTDDDDEPPAPAVAANYKPSTKTKSKQATLGAFFNRK